MARIGFHVVERSGTRFCTASSYSPLTETKSILKAIFPSCTGFNIEAFLAKASRRGFYPL